MNCHFEGFSAKNDTSPDSFYSFGSVNESHCGQHHIMQKKTQSNITFDIILPGTKNIRSEKNRKK